jgi:hypothetical protein
MLPSPRQIALAEHQRWLDYLQPEGLVVSPLALVDSQVQLDTGAYAKTQDQFLDALTPDPTAGEAVVADFARFALNFLGCRDELLSIFSVTAEIPDGLRVSTGEHGDDGLGLPHPSILLHFRKAFRVSEMLPAT